MPIPGTLAALLALTEMVPGDVWTPAASGAGGVGTGALLTWRFLTARIDQVEKDLTAEIARAQEQRASDKADLRVLLRDTEDRLSEDIGKLAKTMRHTEGNITEALRNAEQGRAALHKRVTECATDIAHIKGRLNGDHK